MEGSPSEQPARQVDLVRSLTQQLDSSLKVMSRHRRIAAALLQLRNQHVPKREMDLSSG